MKTASFQSRLIRSVLFPVIALLLGTLALPASAQTVTSPGDDGSSGTLRSVLASAAPGATIHFAPALNGNMISLTCGSGPITISQNVTIVGPGANNLAISGNGQCQILYVNSGVTATISGLTIENGSATGDSNSPAGQGGGIYNSGTLVIDNCAFLNNSAQFGGAIAYQFGAVIISGSLFLNNSAQGGGGAVYPGYSYPITSIIDSTFAGNSALYGGAIANLSGTLELSFDTFSTNTSAYSAGLFNNNSATAILKANLFDDQIGPSCDNEGTEVDEGYNIEDGPTCNFTQTGDQQTLRLPPQHGRYRRPAE